ncbi:homeobox-leucine zipper protein PROTODERMAL FACTOR 2, partial [Morus notabilis]|uniref:homeobox-leucine zipper protein PROTODERMAL FACTOR 2 n=1 Tax=Morus notabilis TaxID=981085 RepID=UPI000CED3372
YPLEGSRETGDNKKKRSKLGHDHPTGHRRAQQVLHQLQIQNIGPHHNEDVLSSSPDNSQTSSEQSSEMHTRESKVSKSNVVVGSNKHNLPLRATDLLMSFSIRTEENKGKIAELASKAMDELRKMATTGGPLWTLDQDKNMETLNDIEYFKEFVNMNATLMDLMRMVEVGQFKPLPRYPKSDKEFFSSTEDFDEEFLHLDLRVYDKPPSQEQLYSKGSREIGYVEMKPAKLVELLMDSKQWSLLFSNIVSRAVVLGVLMSTGMLEQNYDGTLQVMAAEFYAPSPLIPIRETYFSRHCKRLGHGMWGVVDVSLESLFQFPSAKTFRRRPSGCLIEEMPNGYSKVIWIEHVEVDDRRVHKMFEPIVTSGLAFSAKRWVATLARQCALIRAHTSPSIADGVLIIPEAGMRSLLKLSERMVRRFCSELSASATNKWRALPRSRANNRDTTLMMNSTFNKDDHGKPLVATVVFATSVELPATPKKVFDFLSDEESRTRWDILSQGHSIKELARISTGEDPGNHLSLIQVNSTLDKIAILYLQQSCTDATGSYVVFAPLDILSVSRVLNGGNPDFVRILSSGFVILPDVSKMFGGVAHGCLLTLALHIVDDRTSKERITKSVDIMYNIITEAVASIKDAVISSY